MNSQENQSSLKENEAERGSKALNEITILCNFTSLYRPGKEYNEQTILRWEEVDL